MRSAPIVASRMSDAERNFIEDVYNAACAAHRTAVSLLPEIYGLSKKYPDILVATADDSGWEDIHDIFFRLNSYKPTKIGPLYQWVANCVRIDYCPNNVAEMEDVVALVRETVQQGTLISLYMNCGTSLYPELRNNPIKRVKAMEANVNRIHALALERLTYVRHA